MKLGINITIVELKINGIDNEEGSHQYLFYVYFRHKDNGDMRSKFGGLFPYLNENKDLRTASLYLMLQS